jgi:hypothetical protein
MFHGIGHFDIIEVYFGTLKHSSKEKYKKALFPKVGLNYLGEERFKE